MPNLKIALFHSLIYGGAKRSVFELTKVLSKRHTVDLYNLSVTGEDMFDLRPLVRNVYTFKYEKLFFKKPLGFLNIFIDFLNLYRLNKVYFKIARAIDDGGYDIAFIHASFFYYPHFPALLRYLDTPSVFYCQEVYRPYNTGVSIKTQASLKRKILCLLYMPIYKLYTYYFQRNDRYNITQADLVCCNSSYEREEIYKTYTISAKVNYLGVDVQKFKPRDILKENLVLSIGHVEPRKAHDFVILALAALPRQIRPKLSVIYPPLTKDATIGIEHKRYLEQLADDNDVEVLFFEGVSEEELVLFYNKAKLTTCAFISEPFGLVPLESMACQTPVIAIGEGGLKESVIHNQTGILTKRDIIEFSRAIEYLLKNEEIRIKMGRFCRRYVLENWTWEKSAGELEKSFLSIIKN